MIPREAMPVVRLIRERVPRPIRKPELIGTFLRWKGWDCPLGMLPGAKNHAPDCAEDCGLEAHYDKAVRAFGQWFDNQSDPDATMEAVWPR